MPKFIRIINDRINTEDLSSVKSNSKTSTLDLMFSNGKESSIQFDNTIQSHNCMLSIDRCLSIGFEYGQAPERIPIENWMEKKSNFDIASDERASPEQLQLLGEIDDVLIQKTVAQHENTPISSLIHLNAQSEMLMKENKDDTEIQEALNSNEVWTNYLEEEELDISMEDIESEESEGIGI
jgi:hypothetical protein